MHGTEELRQNQLAELAELRPAMWERVNQRPPAADRLGRIVKGEDGEALPDMQAQVAAAAVVLRVSEREAGLRGPISSGELPMAVNSWPGLLWGCSSATRCSWMSASPRLRPGWRTWLVAARC